MKGMVFNLRRLAYWLAQRSVLIVALLIIAVGALLFWYLFAGPSPTQSQLPLGIAAVAAFFAAISAIASLLQAIEVQRERTASQRPYVVFNFEGTGRGAIYFKIENMGNSPARDIEFEFDPAPVDHAGRPLDQVSVFSNPISFLPPGGQIRQIIDSGHRFLAEGKVTRFKVSVRYLSVSGASYQDRVIHDLEYMKQATIPGKTVEESLADIAKDLADIKGVMKGVTDASSLRVEARQDYINRTRSVLPRSARKSIISRIASALLRLFS